MGGGGGGGGVWDKTISFSGSTQALPINYFSVLFTVWGGRLQGNACRVTSVVTKCHAAVLMTSTSQKSIINDNLSLQLGLPCDISITS